MQWPFKTIKQKSSWPFHALLIQLAAPLIQVPEGKERSAHVAKTIERTCRLVARLAVEFKVPPCFIMDTMIEQLIREGGDKFKSHLAAHDDDQGKSLDAALDHQGVLTDFVDSLQKTSEPKPKPN